MVIFWVYHILDGLCLMNIALAAFFHESHILHVVPQILTQAIISKFKNSTKFRVKQGFIFSNETGFFFKSSRM